MCVSTRLNGVTAHLVTDRRNIVAQLAQDIESFCPTVIIVSTEDLSQALLRTAVNLADAPVVYFAHTLQALPCGPAAFFPSASGANLLQKVDSIISISEYLSSYILRWAGRTANLVHPPVYGSPPFPSVSPTCDGFVAMVNPCNLKGMEIFLQLADRMPHARFAAVPGWGTLESDVHQLEARRNVSILSAYDNVDQLLSQTSILLVPSLWQETFGHVAVEAMLRGVPVIASAVGGLQEAMLGVDYCIPVNAIEKYTEEVDERLSPVPIVPDQDIRPWEQVCMDLLSDTSLYVGLSSRSCRASHEFVQSISWDPVESLLLSFGE